MQTWDCYANDHHICSLIDVQYVWAFFFLIVCLRNFVMFFFILGLIIYRT